MKQIIIRLVKNFCLIPVILLVISSISVYGQQNNEFLSSPSVYRIKSYREDFLSYIKHNRR